MISTFQLFHKNKNKNKSEKKKRFFRELHSWSNFVSLQCAMCLASHTRSLQSTMRWSHLLFHLSNVKLNSLRHVPAGIKLIRSVRLSICVAAYWTNVSYVYHDHWTVIKENEPSFCLWCMVIFRLIYADLLSNIQKVVKFSLSLYLSFQNRISSVKC